MVGVLGVVFHYADHGVGIDEPGQVVHVTVGVVARDAVPQPKNVPNAKIFPQGALDLLPAQLRVPVAVQQAGLGGEQGPGPVHVQGSPFQHHPRRHHREAQLLPDPGGDGVVRLEGRVLSAPGVEAPVDDQLLPPAGRLALEKNRPVVPTPGVVGGVRVEEQPLGGNPRGPQDPAGRRLQLGVAGEDVHLLPRRQVPNDLREPRRHRLEPPGPGGFPVRPAEPGAPVAGPLGGHPETQLRG